MYVRLINIVTEQYVCTYVNVQTTKEQNIPLPER